MRIFSALVVCITMSFSQISATPVLAKAYVGEDIVRMKVGGSFAAPIGFQIFCLKQPAHCRGGGSAQVSLTSSTMSNLQAVNAQVNRSIRPVSDKNDTWSVNVRQGDCEDYALTKRAALIARGLPASALRLAAVRTRGGVGHAVLVVRTDKGDYVLDNLTGQVKEWRKTGLRWVALSGENPRQWQKVG